MSNIFDGDDDVGEGLEVRNVNVAGGKSYEIVRGRPAPEPAKKGRAGASKYPVEHLEIGEAFPIKGVKRSTVEQMKTKAHKTFAKEGRRFRIEETPDGFWFHRVEDKVT